ncbi:MAG: flagellar basal body protein [Pseudomonadota bacterium]
MNPFSKITAAAVSGMKAQTTRLQAVSENIANADTHGYRRKLVTFRSMYDQADGVTRVDAADISLDETELSQRFEPNHPFANEEGFVVGSNVNIMTEFGDAREANRSYDAGIEVYKQARSMFSSLLELLRR